MGSMMMGWLGVGRWDSTHSAVGVDARVWKARATMYVHCPRNERACEDRIREGRLHGSEAPAPDLSGGHSSVYRVHCGWQWVCLEVICLRWDSS